MQPYISIVTTLYKSAGYLCDFLAFSSEALKRIGCKNYEIIMVNDGSPDDSLERALDLKAEYDKLKIVDLSRNFGHHNALIAGLEYAKGDCIFLADCDLEVSPLILVDMYSKYLEIDGIDALYGIQKKRRGGFIKGGLGKLFYNIFDHLTTTKIPRDRVTEQILSRRYVNAILEMGDFNLFLPGIMAWVGFKQIPYEIEKEEREGKSSYTFIKRCNLAFNGIVSFSSYPLILMFKIGILIASLSFIFGAYCVIMKLLYVDTILTGYTSIILLILFSLGIIIASLGILGVYIDKLFNQVKNRPKYIVKQAYE